MFAYDHEDKVDDPNNGEPEYKTDKSGYDFALRESRDPAADPCRYRYDRKDDAHDVGQSEVIALICHNAHSLFFYYLYYIVIIRYCQENSRKFFFFSLTNSLPWRIIS